MSVKGVKHFLFNSPTGAKYRIPQKVMYVEDLTAIMMENFPDLWKLGQAYFTGEFINKLEVRTDIVNIIIISISSSSTVADLRRAPGVWAPLNFAMYIKNPQHSIRGWSWLSATILHPPYGFSGSATDEYHRYIQNDNGYNPPPPQ